MLKIYNMMIWNSKITPPDKEKTTEDKKTQHYTTPGRAGN
jgi:hypothetical protein